MLKLKLLQVCNAEEFVDVGAKRLVTIPLLPNMTYEQISEAIFKAVDAEAEKLDSTLETTLTLAAYGDLLGSRLMLALADEFSVAAEDLAVVAEDLRQAGANMGRNELEPIFMQNRKRLRSTQLNAYFMVEGC